MFTLLCKECSYPVGFSETEHTDILCADCFKSLKNIMRFIYGDLHPLEQVKINMNNEYAARQRKNRWARNVYKALIELDFTWRL